MIYEEYFTKGEATRWQLDSDISWEDINIDLALEQRGLLDTLKRAALIESYAPMFAMKGLEVWWDSVEESAVASVQFYEEYKHYFALKKYLEIVGYDFADHDLISMREESHGTHYADRNRQLANYMISEHFTAHFYMALLEQAKEPVLKTLLTFLMKDEFRHRNVFYELLERRIKENPSIADIVLDEAVNFNHMGVEAVGDEMPVAKKNDMETIVLFMKTIEHLTGTNLIQFKKKQAKREKAKQT